MSESWRTIGRVGVDSGRLMVIDPCYVEDCKDYEKLAVVFESGFGDGIYEVKALWHDYGRLGKRIKEVRIILIKED